MAEAGSLRRDRLAFRGALEQAQSDERYPNNGEQLEPKMRFINQQIYSFLLIARATRYVSAYQK